jgi:putative Mg2+ transporter-C (MgtC) family protein
MSGLLDWLVSLPEQAPWLRLDLLGHLSLAAALGGLIGWERERSQKPAGLRTNVLICVGAALLADLSTRGAELAGAAGDPTRIAAQVVTGVGFLGAGAIMQQRGSVTGLTTAATIWVVAAIGLAAGFGAVVEATGTAMFVLVALAPLRRIEERVNERREGDRRQGDRRAASQPTVPEAPPPDAG